MWLGGMTVVRGSWMWYMTGEDFTYINWCKNEPNNRLDREFSMNMELYDEKHRGCWNDKFGDYTCHYLCQ